LQLDEYDSPWKSILDYFEDFMSFFFPNAYGDIDWSEGYNFLDGELQKVLRQGQTGRRHVDKLIEVTLKGRGKTWLLIHVEIQSTPEVDFAARIFVYDNRLYDHFGKKVVSLVVLADDRENWRPHTFGYELWGYKHYLTFPSAKLLDYADTEPSLETADNIFALVVLAHLASRKTKDDHERREEVKRRLLRLLFQKGYDRDRIFALMAFLDWVLTLPKEIDDKLWKDVDTWKEVVTMKYIPSFARESYAEGKSEGKSEGITEVLVDLLNDRFGSIPEWVNAKIQNAPLDRLKIWIKNVHRRNNLEEVFE
jgi:hypothetical protein